MSGAFSAELNSRTKLQGRAALWAASLHTFAAKPHPEDFPASVQKVRTEIADFISAVSAARADIDVGDLYRVRQKLLDINPNLIRARPADAKAILMDAGDEILSWAGLR